jgi:hypothetical protein
MRFIYTGSSGNSVYSQRRHHHQAGDFSLGFFLGNRLAGAWLSQEVRFPTLSQLLTVPYAYGVPI